MLDSIKLLERNPRPSGAHPYGKGCLRMRVGFYRVLYEVVSESPVIVSVEHVGRGSKP